MRRVRVIPLLMLDGGRAVVTRGFAKPVYVGDPLNTIRIFNEKEVDELFIVDISRQPKKGRPDFDLIAKLASESFMPLAYGGHIRSAKDAATIINCGVEKVSFNTALFTNPEIVQEVSLQYGRQSVIASIDYKSNIFGKPVMRTELNTRTVDGPFEGHIKRIVSLGVGEMFLNSIERDGKLSGYDIPMIRSVSTLIDVPLVACGGGSSLYDMKTAIDNGASAVAAGAMFYFKGSFDAVLINYPAESQIRAGLYDLLD